MVLVWHVVFTGSWYAWYLESQRLHAIVRQHVGVLMAFLGLLVLWKYFGWIVFATACLVGFNLLLRHAPAWRYRRAVRREARQRARDRAIARAEAENRDWLAGGIYEGNYPGATMPLTHNGNLALDDELDHYYGEPRDWYDYDDGLKEWK